MNLIEALTKAPLEITELTDVYIARILIDGKCKYYRPVDLRLKSINIPLSPSDLELVYDNVDIERNIHRVDSTCKFYYPSGSNIKLNDGTELIVNSYGSPSIYHNLIHVDLNCKLKNEESTIIENINTDNIKRKVMKELDSIIESNEMIKSILPKYSYNWLTFNDDDLEAVKKYNADKLLKYIDMIQNNETKFYTNQLASILDYSSSTTNSFNVYAYKLSKIWNKEFIKIGINGVHALYNPRYSLEWIIYVNDKLNLNILEKDIYLINSSGMMTKIETKVSGRNFEIKFNTPKECSYDYVLYLEDVNSTGSYIEYNISKLTLKKISKIDIPVEEYYTFKNEQTDLLDTATQIISIISATNIEEYPDINTYYENIDNLIINIKPELNYSSTNIDDETSIEEGDEEDESTIS